MILAIFGVTKTGIVNEFCQLLARSIFAFITISHADPNKGPWISGAFFAFAIGETVRYPFFFFKSMGVKKKTIVTTMIANMKYNFFIVFYPIGAFCDCMTAVSAADNIEAKNAYSILLPNSFNMSFSMSWVCRTLIPTLYLMIFPLNYGLLLANRRKYYRG